MITATDASHMIHLCAPNDSNGNPQRAWAQYDWCGVLVGWFEEGYSGVGAVPNELDAQRLAAPSIRVTTKEWLTWKRAYEDMQRDKEYYV
jgi:hypothetical protein